MPVDQLQPSPDSVGVALVWNLVESLNTIASNAHSPTDENGWAFGIKVLIIFLALLVLAVFGLCGSIVFIFVGWRRQQSEGIKALSTNKDRTKQEITDLLRNELGRARDAATADNAEIKAILTKHGDTIGLVVLDLVVIAQKTKVQLRSSPTHHVIKKED